MGTTFDPNAFTANMASFSEGGLGLGGIGASSASSAIGAGTSAAGGIMSGIMGGAALGPAGMIAGAVLSGVSSYMQAKQQKKSEQRAARQGLYNEAYSMALEDWYGRRDKNEKRMALENYNQFNTMDQISPGYEDVYKPAEVGDIPDSRAYVAGNNKKTIDSYANVQKTEANKTVGSVKVPGGT